MTLALPLPEAVSLLGLDYTSPYRDCVLDLIEERFRRLAARLPRPQNAAAWQQRAADLRAPLLHTLGLSNFPARAPLNSQTVGVIERPTYVVEKLIFEARPGFPISAHLYLPRQTAWPAPAVLYSLGHWMETGKLEPDVQICCANLAQLGIVTLVYDMIGQGERLGECPFDHGHLEPLLVGQCQEGLMVWESMRAIDLLVSRPEVDASRIGMTGSSGGGLNTFYTAAVDERIGVSVPVCYVDTFLAMVNAERDRNWEDGVDLCNQAPGVAAYAEMWDICGMIAPKPQCIIAAEHDWLFPIAGVHEVYQEVARIYRLLDAPERVRLVAVDAPHGYDQEMRQAAYGWFARWLLGHGDGAPLTEAPCDLILPPTLSAVAVGQRQGGIVHANPGLCFPNGQAPAVGPAITALTQQCAAQLPPPRAAPASADAWAKQRINFLTSVQTLLGPWPEVAPVRGPWIDLARDKRKRLYNRTVFNGLIGERLVFESEPGIELPAIFLAPAQWQAPLPVVIYLDEWGKRAGLHNGLIDALLAAQLSVLAVDVRGVGEVAASDFEATTNALMTDRPFFGQQVWDLLQTVDCLWRGAVTGRTDGRRIGCVGRGLGGLWALYGAALDPRITTTALWQTPISYHDLICEHPAWPASAYLFNVLNHYDLPDLMATVAPRPLMVAEPLDGERKPLAGHIAKARLRQIQTLYELLAAHTQTPAPFALADHAVTPLALAAWLRAQLAQSTEGQA